MFALIISVVNSSSIRQEGEKKISATVFYCVFSVDIPSANVITVMSGGRALFSAVFPSRSSREVPGWLATRPLPPPPRPWKHT